MEEKRVWCVHTPDSKLFLEGNIIAIGWSEMGDVSAISPNREAYKSKYSEAYPNEKKRAAALGAGIIFRFVCEAQTGDYIIHPSKIDRKVNIGVIESGYYHNPEEPDYKQQRKVRWLREGLSRMLFSQGALYEIGSAMTFFSVKNYADEFLSALNKGFGSETVAVEEDETIAKTAEEIKDSTTDFILKELSANLKGYGLEPFVADLLRAMGYRTQLSPQGGDGGIDIIAYKDELPPRILVQIKSEDSNIAEKALQALKGAMSPGDYGLFVTLSDYTKNAQRFLAGNPIIRGIEGTELVELILKYYDKLSERYREMIPLEKVYIPVARE